MSVLINTPSPQTFPLPSFTDSIDLRYFLEPLTGVGPPLTYLDRFPDELYHKAPDSHFVRFMYALLGPTGIGWLTKALLNLRLQLEAAGLENADLDAFYGDPLSFARSIDERFDDDISGLLPRATWNTIKSQDESYRSRAIRYLHGARLGNTPAGMKLVAESGLGQNVEIVENYRALFDSHVDDPLGLPYLGSSYDLGEWIIRPRPVISRTVVVTISFDLNVTAGAFFMEFNGRSTLDDDAAHPVTTLPWTASALDVAAALSALSTIGQGNVLVVGGPIPIPFIVTFTGALANQTLPALIVASDPNNPLVDSMGILQNVHVTSTTGTIDASQEVVPIAAADKRSMQVAIDYLRPVGTYPTFSQGRGVQGLQAWQDVVASTESVEVVRYVTGSSAVSWPATDNTNWIVRSVENEAPRLSDQPNHYVGFHNVSSIQAHTDAAFAGVNEATEAALPLLFSSAVTIPAQDPLSSQFRSVHVGSFTPQISGLMPFFAQFNNTNIIFAADDALAPYSEILSVTGQTSDNIPLINGIYPLTSLGLQGIPIIRRQDETFWASQERPDGTDVLFIDLGTTQAVNFIAFETTRKPVDIQIDYDVLDQYPQYTFEAVTPDPNYLWEPAVFFDPNEQSPWTYLEYHFDDGHDMIFTRFIQISLSRRPDQTTYGRFLFDPIQQVQTPWSVDIRNLRIGRNVVPALT